MSYFQLLQSFPSKEQLIKFLVYPLKGINPLMQIQLLFQSGLKVGDEIQVPGDKTINAIKNLWALNIFSDVQDFD